MTRLSACLGLVMLIPLPVLADEVRPPSAIESVIVYAEGASVTRRVPFTLPAGASTIILENLPVEIETDSLKVDGSADQSLAISSVETRRVPADPAADPKRKALTDTLRGIEDRLSAINDRIGALKGRRQFIERLIETLPSGFGRAIGQATGGIDLWAAASEAIGLDLAAVAEARRALERERRAIDEEKEKIRKALAELPPPREAVVLRIEVSAAEPASGALTVSYRVPSASWVPAYDALLTTDEAGGKPTVTIVRRAEVAQATGEDWSNVALTLSTARPASGTGAPELEPSLVSVYVSRHDGLDGRLPDESVTSGGEQAPPRAGEPMSKLTGDDGVLQPVKIGEAAADFGDFRAEYHIPGNVSVASGVGARGLRIGSGEETAELEVRGVPAVAASAYLHARFMVPLGAPMLPGRISLFRDGGFVGSSEVAFTNAGAKLVLGFGTDDQVKVIRTVLQRETGETGLLSTRRTDARSFRITVENLHRRPINVTIFDRMPYSESEDIVVVRADEATPPTIENVDDRRGVLAWTYSYAPGESRDIINAYEVSWPGSESVVVLD